MKKKQIRKDILKSIQEIEKVKLCKNALDKAQYDFLRLKIDTLTSILKPWDYPYLTLSDYKPNVGDAVFLDKENIEPIDGIKYGVFCGERLYPDEENIDIIKHFNCDLMRCFDTYKMCQDLSPLLCEGTYTHKTLKTEYLKLAQHIPQVDIVKVMTESIRFAGFLKTTLTEENQKYINQVQDKKTHERADKSLNSSLLNCLHAHRTGSLNKHQAMKEIKAIILEYEK